MNEGDGGFSAGPRHLGHRVAIEAKGGVRLALGLIHGGMSRGVDDGGGREGADQVCWALGEKIAARPSRELKPQPLRNRRPRQFPRHLSGLSKHQDRRHIQPRHLNHKSGKTALSTIRMME
jgi:hypothetical protein